VKQVLEKITNDETGTTFLLAADGLYVIRRLAVEEEYEIHQQQMSDPDNYMQDLLDNECEIHLGPRKCLIHSGTLDAHETRLRVIAEPALRLLGREGFRTHYPGDPACNYPGSLICC